MPTNYSDSGVMASVIPIFIFGVLGFIFLDGGTYMTLEMLFKIFEVLIGPLFAAGFGAYVGYRGIRRGQDMDVEQKHIDSINTVLYLLKHCIDIACSWKRRYAGKLGVEPQRSFRIPRIFGEVAKVESPVISLLFLVARAGKNSKTIDLNLVDIAFRNFNILIDTIKKRNELMDFFFEKAEAQYTRKGIVKGDLKEADATVGKANIDEIVMLSEEMIQNVDRVLSGLYQSLQSLQEIALISVNRNLVPRPVIMKFEY